MPWNAKEAIREVGMQRILADLIEELDGEEPYIVQLKFDLEAALENYQARYDNEDDDE